MRKVTILGFFCLALILAAMPFAACAQPAPAQAPVVIQPTPAVTTPAAAPAAAPAAPAVTPAPAPATPVVAPPAAPAAPAGPTEPVYACMDPRSYMEAIPFIGLNPRLDTLVGKKIGVANLMGGNAEALSTVASAIMEAYPGCEAEYMEVRDRRSPEWLEWVQTCDAIILGNNY